MKPIQMFALILVFAGLLLFFTFFTLADAPGRFSQVRTIAGPNGTVSYVRGAETERWKQWRWFAAGSVTCGGGLIFCGAALGLFSLRQRPFA